MGSRLAFAFTILIGVSLAACGPSPQNQGDGGGGGNIDANPNVDPDANNTTSPDAGNAYPDAMPYTDGGSCTDWVCTNPVDDGCMIGQPDVCGNGTDEDCDGNVDEGCTCQSGAVQACFRGPPGRRGVGSCVDGMQTCQGSGEFTFWGPCTGGITPTDEACDTQDNNCNGCADDNPECCVVNLSCPGPGDLPDGQPFVDYVIDGSAFYSGAVQTWSWTVSGGPCDQLFVSQGLAPTYTLAGANTSMLTLHPTLSGDYTVTVTITTPDGTVYTCTFIVHVAGPGLRVETCSDVTGTTDLDLHVHKAGTTTPWFTTALSGSNYNPDDCYYMNCKATTYGGVADWGYASSPITECNGGPEGADWADNVPAVCRNPRLDIDSIYDLGTPENINVDNPINNGTYRVMLHYYSGGTIQAHPMVNVYCGGYLLGSYGAAPDLITNFDTSGGFGAGDMWRVVDVQTLVDGAGVTTGCNLTPLHPPGQTTGYWVTTNDRSY
jgi:hypothetical protein